MFQNQHTDLQLSQNIKNLILILTKFLNFRISTRIFRTRGYSSSYDWLIWSSKSGPRPVRVSSSHSFCVHSGKTLYFIHEALSRRRLWPKCQNEQLPFSKSLLFWHLIKQQLTTWDVLGSGHIFSRKKAKALIPEQFTMATTSRCWCPSTFPSRRESCSSIQISSTSL